MSRTPTMTPKEDARILRVYRSLEQYGAIKILTERFNCSETKIQAALERARAAEAAAQVAA